MRPAVYLTLLASLLGALVKAESDDTCPEDWNGESCPCGQSSDWACSASGHFFLRCDGDIGSAGSWMQEEDCGAKGQSCKSGLDPPTFGCA